MSWTTPKTWQVDELLTAANLNTHLRDNLNALKAPPSQAITRDNGSAYSTTSTDFVAVDSANLKAALTTNGGDVLIWFWGVFHADQVGRRVGLDIRVDGEGRVGADYAGGLLNHRLGTTIGEVVNLGPLLIAGLSAGEHTFELLWKANAGTVTLHADANDADDVNEVPAVLVAREVS